MSDPNRDGSPPLAPAGPRGLNASGMSTASVGLNDTTETYAGVGWFFFFFFFFFFS